MKLFLLIMPDQDDHDHVFGVFDSLDKAEAAKSDDRYLFISMAEIREMELNEYSGRTSVSADGSSSPPPPELLRAFASSPWSDLVP
jgi:hypothetical protein